MNRRGKTAKKFAGGKGEFLYPFGWSCCIDHSSSSLSAEAKKRKGETSNFATLHSKPPLRLRTKVPSIPFNPPLAPLGLTFGKGKPGHGFF